MSSNLETLAIKQKADGEEIERLARNYRKDGPTRRTKEYLQQRLQNLEIIWNRFEERQQDMEEDRDNDPDHPYFASKYYEKVREVYYVTKTSIEKELIKSGEVQGTSSKQVEDEQKEIIPNNKSEQSLRFRKQKALTEALLRLITVLEQEGRDRTRAYYQCKLKMLSIYWDNISQNHINILANASEEDQQREYFINNLFAEIEDTYHAAVIEIQEKLDAINTPLQCTSSEDGFPQITRVKLPLLRIPIFSGTYHTWVAFRDLFVKTIHLNEGLAKSQKMQYLKTNVTGEAERLIRHLSVSDDNYETAWTLLVNRYDNKRVLVSTHIQLLLSQPKLSQESASGLKRLHDTTKECIYAINNLQVTTRDWSPILIHLLVQKLDKETHRLYENSISKPKEVPHLDEFLEFLEGRFHSLEALADNQGQRSAPLIVNKREDFGKYRNHQVSNKDLSYKAHHSSIDLRCNICRGHHLNNQCESLLKMNPRQRFEISKQNKLCMNCLQSTHTTLKCPSQWNCKICRKRHHTILHQSINLDNPKESKVKETKLANTEVAGLSSGMDIQSHFAGNQEGIPKTLLATALVKITSRTGHTEIIRALIDQGSEASFITEDIVQRMYLPRTKIQATIEGIGATKALTSRSITYVTIGSIYPSTFKQNVRAFVLESLTKCIPKESIDKPEWNHIQGLALADPNFYTPGPINMILGAEVYSGILMNKLIRGIPGTPMAQETRLGWILSGPTRNIHNYATTRITSCVSLMDIDQQLRKFWEIEEVQETRKNTPEEDACEKFYVETVRRNSMGRYIAKIPFKTSPVQIGESRKQAIAQLLQLERKFRVNKELAERYKEFMAEYQLLGHMERVPASELRKENPWVYYLPHHSVFKQENGKSKLRVVFNASSRTSNGMSLNDNMLVGPKLQDDIFDVLLRWRTYKIALTADVEKMYRQILIDGEDCDFQRIVWRYSPEEPIAEYRLTTVTYGTTSAPFIAKRTLKQLALDYQGTYPKASEVTLRDFYVDDLMTGANSEKEARQLKEELSIMLSHGGFSLRKWASNITKVLAGTPRDLQAEGIWDIAADDSIKALGIQWHPKDDTFGVKINLVSETPVTKRGLISDTSKLFDPLGWLAPIIIKAKILYQETWLAGLSWDQELPANIAEKWKKYRNSLKRLEEIKIPRWIELTTSVRKFELHGFSDASEQAYSAAVYSRVENNNGKIHTTLLCSKTRVAPIKPKVSLPRLELCGAHLLAKLLQQVAKTLVVPNTALYAWTDSKITLAWIQGNPNKWKPFVANRVNEIQFILNPAQWHYVSSNDNPADCASRGIYPEALLDHSLWWQGPTWLRKAKIPMTPIQETTELESKAIIIANVTTATSKRDDILLKYSKLSTALRVMAYCLRFSANTRTAKRERTLGPLTAQEIQHAMTIMIRLTQEELFQEEITALKSNTNLKCNSQLLPLRPFLDKANLLRVGGRLQHSELPPEVRHPIILPKKSHLTTLVIGDAHLTTLHGGMEMTLTYIRQRYWILQARQAVRSFIHQCVICHRYNTRATQQLMGSLPAPRVTVSRPFFNTGVDYAGPLSIRMSKGRGNRSYKGYIVLFICLATKAIHLEAVTDLTAEAFIAAFKRFTGRRGFAANMYSDNATNFVLANKILGLNQEEYNRKVVHPFADVLASKGINWHFIPAASPHFGGLWEAGVKSVKRHLVKTIGEHKLTYEELVTTLIQIEACLNSRPLCPTNDDPNDLEVLTPGHFLTGAALLAPPEPNLTDININHLKRWQLTTRLSQDFWKKWSREYISRLQERPKWTQQRRNIQTGDIVLIRDEQLPPLKWPMGRVEAVYPGADGLNRVATIRAKGTTFTRAVNKLSLLPITNALEDPPPGSSTSTQATHTQLELSQEGANLPTQIVTMHQKSLGRKGSETTSVLKEVTEHRTAPSKRTEKEFREMLSTATTKMPSRRKRKKIQPSSIPPRPTLEELISQCIKKPKKNPITSASRTPSEKTGPSARSLSSSTLISIITFIALIPLVIGQTSDGFEPFRTFPFKNRPGIFFEELGDVQLITDEWNIIVFYQLDAYWQELKGIRKCIYLLNEYCTEVNASTVDKNYCNLISTQLNHQLQQLEDQNNIILQNRLSVEPRRKRGLVNIVGTVANELFGVLDNRFATQYEKQIQAFRENEEHLLKLIKAQTSIAESTGNIIKKDREQVQDQFEEFNNQLKNIRGILEHQEALRFFQYLTTQAVLLITNFKDTQKLLVDLVIDTQQGRTSPLVLTPQQLTSQLDLIRRQLPDSLTIPGAEDPNKVFELYQTMKAKIRVTTNNAIISLRLPIASKEKFQLLKIVPVPTLHGNQYIFIEPSTEYIIVNLRRDLYYPLREMEVRSCQRTTNKLFLCHPHHPIYTTESNFSRCEIGILNHNEELDKSCHVASMNTSKVWIQLENPNMWIFVFNKEYTFNVICGTRIFTERLSDEGILQLTPGCVIKQPSMTIASHSLYSTQLNTSFIPAANLSTLVQLRKGVTLSKPSSSSIKSFNVNDIVQLKEEISHVSNMELEGISTHDIHQYVVIYMVLTALILAAAVWVYRILQGKTVRSLEAQEHAAVTPTSHPIPQKRCLTTNDFVVEFKAAPENA